LTPNKKYGLSIRIRFRQRDAKPQTQLRGDFAMAGQAKGAEVVEIALAAAFRYGNDVVGVPKRAARVNGLHTPEGEGLGTGLTAAALELGVDGDGLGGAQRADAAVAGEDLVAEIAGIGTQPPLVHAVVGAEGAAAASEDLQLAPAAERATVSSGRQLRRPRATGFGQSPRSWSSRG
jgi:hypothetical protein